MTRDLAGKSARPPIAVALLAMAVLAAGSLQLARSGYSVDEEFTVFAVRGIQATGLPLLPSGLLYDRGLAYSYAASLAGALTGSELPAFRALSLLSAVLSIGLAFVLVRRVASQGAAVLAATLTSASIPFWATATSARFYAPFFAVYLAVLILLTHRSAWIALLAGAVLARLLHELAFTLAAVPLVCWLLARGNRRHWFFVTAAVTGGLVVGQLILFAVHYAAPSSGDTMVRRFFLWQVLNLFERPGDRQFLIPIVVMVVGWVVAPRRAWTIAVVSLSIAAMILSFSIAQASNSAPLSWALVQSELAAGSRYPLDMFWHVATTMPITLGAGLMLLAARVVRGDWPPGQRAAHALWIGWVLWFGVIESGITANYLLLPVSFLLMAIAVDAGALKMPPVVLALLALAVGVDQWRGGSLDAARPTIVADGIAEIRAGLQPDDRVVCTDELGCLMTIGRIDRWLALDDFVRERFLVRRGDGPVSGVYTGVAAAFRPSDLFTPDPGGAFPSRVLIVDIFKDYPIGNSRSWLPKAIEEDGLQVTPLLETPQLRVLQVSPPERVVSASARQPLR